MTKPKIQYRNGCWVVSFKTISISKERKRKIDDEVYCINFKIAGFWAKYFYNTYCIQ